MPDDTKIARLSSGEAWHDFCDRLRDAGDQILAAAPDDDFDRAEGFRYLARLTSHFLRSTIDESDPAMALLASSSPKIGLDDLHRQTHVNHETAAIEDDGTIRILVSAKDPGHPNWLDTAGHRRGALALRWLGADATLSQPRRSVLKLGSPALLS